MNITQRLGLVMLVMWTGQLHEPNQSVLKTVVCGLLMLVGIVLVMREPKP